MSDQEKALQALERVVDRIKRGMYWNAIATVQLDLMPSLICLFNDALKNRKIKVKLDERMGQNDEAKT